MTSRGAIRIACRVTVVLLGAVLASSATLSAGRAYWGQDPDNAPSLVATSPAIRLMQAETRRIRPGWLAEHGAAVRENARAVLRRDPLEAVALRQLAELEPVPPDRRVRLLRLSERVTRREPITQVLLVNEEAGANSTAQALVHYDRALTIWPQLGTTLLPVLASALSDPPIAGQLSRFADRPWFRPLLGAGLERGAPVAAVARLARSAQAKLPEDDRRSLSGELIGKLLASERPGDVRALVTALQGPERVILEDISINQATTDPRAHPLSWSLSSDAAVSSEFVAPSRIAITVVPSGSGVAARRLTLIQPGSYVLFVRYSYAQGTPRAALEWIVECRDGRTIWRTSLPGDRMKGSYGAWIDVPSGCNQQSWRLEARADDSQFASSASIDLLSLRVN